MDAVVDGVFKNAPEPQWLEDYVFGDFRAWQIIFLTFTGLTAIIIALCCCIKFRIPRTKQQIEADFQRRVITKKFREQLERIQNSDMDAIDLKAALDLVRAEFDNESEKEHQQSASLISSIASQGASSDENSVNYNKAEGNHEQTGDRKDVKLLSIFNFGNRITALVRKSKQRPEDTVEIC